MANQIATVGSHSTGKTSALRTLPSEEVFIISPTKADLPWGGSSSKYKVYDPKTKGGNMMITNNLSHIPLIMKEVSNNMPHIKYLVIDDITHFFNKYTTGEQFRAKGKTKDSWSRWGDFGADALEALMNNVNSLRDDLWIIYHFHAEQYMENGSEKLKIQTPGKLLENEFSIPSYFNYIFYSKVEPYDKDNPKKDRYFFVTNDDGYFAAKTPMGAFDEMYVPNDYKLIIDRIQEYKNKEQ